MPPYTERNHNLIPFSQALSLSQLTPHTYSAQVHPHWSHAPAAHGGYLVSVAQSCVKLHFATTLAKLEQPDTFSIHYEFLLPVSVGEVEIEVRELRVGKGTSTVQFWLRQGGKKEPRGTGFASNCGMKAIKNTISLDLSYPPQPALPPIDFNAVLVGQDPNWIRYDVFCDESSSVGALGNLVFAMLRNSPTLPTASAAEKRVNQQWISPRHPEQNWTTEMLGIFLDMGSPVPEAFFEDTLHATHRMAKRAVENERTGKDSFDHPAWGVPRFYPTVNMGFEVKRPLPKEGEKWLNLRWHTKEVVDGRFDIDIEVWNPQNQLVATGTALFMIVDITRRVQAGFQKKEMKSSSSKI